MPGGIQSMGSQRVRRDCVTKHRFVISFLPKSKHLLALWPGSLSTLILEPKKIKSVTVSIFFFNMAAGKWGADRGLFGNSVPLVKGSFAL